MRDIVFKALTSKASKKQDVCVQEAIEKDGILAKTERRCRYFIMDKDRNAPRKKRHYYILKIHNTETGEDKLLCKIAGTFYAVYDQDTYCIAYVHSFRINFVVTDHGI